MTCRLSAVLVNSNQPPFPLLPAGSPCSPVRNAIPESGAPPASSTRPRTVCTAAAAASFPAGLLVPGSAGSRAPPVPPAATARLLDQRRGGRGHRRLRRRRARVYRRLVASREPRQGDDRSGGSDEHDGDDQLGVHEHSSEGERGESRGLAKTGQERAEPGLAPAAFAVEPLAQQRQAARDAVLDRRRRRARSLRDRARRQALEEAHQDRAAVGLVELEHVRGQLAEDQHALHEVLRAGITRAAGELFARRAPALRSAMLAHEVAHHAREPGPEAARLARSVLERHDTGILRQLVGRLRVARQRARHGPDPLQVLLQDRRGRTGLGAGAHRNDHDAARGGFEAGTRPEFSAAASDSRPGTARASGSPPAARGAPRPSAPVPRRAPPRRPAPPADPRRRCSCAGRR